MSGDHDREAALALARTAVEEWVRTGLLAEPPGDVPPALQERCGVFVTLRVGGRLRGCIGTLAPTRIDAAHEIIASAVAAATHDSRFPPVTPSELADLAYEVDIVGPLEAASGPGALDPKIYGVVVEALEQRGVLLPDLAGIDSADQQIAIARVKAGVAPETPVALYRFRVRRFVEEA